MEIHLKIIGILLILLAVMHIPFPKYFKWKEELASLSLMNRQMMYYHSFFIGLTVFLMGILCLFCSRELIETELGNKIAMGLFAFWGLRFFIQLFGYSSKLWRGKTFETIIHIVFTFFWLYLSVVFLLVFWKTAVLG